MLSAGTAIILHPFSACLASLLDSLDHIYCNVVQPLDFGFLSIIVPCFKVLSDILCACICLVLMNVVNDTSGVGLTFCYSSDYVLLGCTMCVSA